MKSFDGIKTTKHTELQFKRKHYHPWESCDVVTLRKYLNGFVLPKDLRIAELKIVIYANNDKKILL